MDEGAVLSFVRSSIKSAWSLELLLLLHRNPQRSWSGEGLVRELRGSPPLVSESLGDLRAAGIVEISENGARYRPQSRELGALTDALIELYRQKPTTVLHTIFNAPSDKIRSFADAFLFRKDTDK